RRRSSWAGATSAKGVRRTRRHRAEGDPQGRARIIATMRALAFVLLLLLFLSSAAPAQDEAGVARERKAGVERLLRERPADPVLWFYLARFDAEAGNTRGVIAALEKVDALGEGFLPARDLGFAKV